MVKHAPSAEGEFETGCFTFDANNMALIVGSSGNYHKDIQEEVMPAWQDAMKQAQSKTLMTTREEIEMASLGWLLANQQEFYQVVAAEAAVSHEDPEEKFLQLTTKDLATIRDWFCWLHRHLVFEAKEKQRWEAQYK